MLTEYAEYSTVHFVSQRAPKRRFRIEEHPTQPGVLALHDDTDAIVELHKSAFVLAGFAFERGADEVSHNHDLVKREGSR